MRPIALAAAFGTSAGCRAPPDAPRRLEDLCGYLFGHLDDDDDAELAAGLENLDRWLGRHLEDTLEGYSISRLDREWVEDLDSRERSVRNLVGAAVASESDYKPRRIVRALILGDQEEIFSKTYDVYDRDWKSDPDCFPGRDCTFLQAALYAESSWAGLITVTSRATNQYRWVDTEEGWMMVQRSWFKEPADVSLDGMTVDAQYYLAVTMPRKGGAVRLQATWIDADYGSLPVSEDFAKTLIVRSMQGTHEQLEDWLDDQ